MKKTILSFLGLAIIVAALCSTEAFGQRRRVVVRSAPHSVRTTRVVVRPGHPIQRALPAAVVRPAHNTVVVRAPLVYLPALAWRSTVVTLPVRERLVWQDSETIARDEEWVDANFGIDASGDALFLDIGGKAKLNFAEVTFANGNVQVVDFNEQTHGSGLYKLLDFADGRHVSTMRLLAKSESANTRLTVYLSK